MPNSPTPETVRMAEKLSDKINRNRETVIGGYEHGENQVEIIAQALTEAVQGVREAALEEAALECEKCFTESNNGMQLISRGYADKIRALKSQPPASQGTGGLEELLIELDNLVNYYGIDTIGTGSYPPKTEQARVCKILDAVNERCEKRAALARAKGRGGG